MNSIIKKLYQKNTNIYKILLFLFTTIAIVYLFPKGGQFKYDYTQGKPWQYENLYAPFDFALQKTTAELEIDKKQIIENTKQYYSIKSDKKKEVLEHFKNIIKTINTDSLQKTDLKEIEKLGEKIINTVYEVGFVENIKSTATTAHKVIELRNGNNVKTIPFEKLVERDEVLAIIKNNTSSLKNEFSIQKTKNILTQIISPNISYDKKFTEKEIEEQLNNLSLTKGKITKDDLIILKGDIVEGRRYIILESFKNASKSQIWSKSNYYWIVFGYTLLVSLALLMLLLFLHQYRNAIFNNNNKVTFIFFNIFFMILMQTMVVKYSHEYLYVVPLSILPIVIKAFFDARLALFTHLLTILLLGFIVPNSFEFIYLHIIAGIATILTVSELYKRANLFISIAQVTLIYMLTYVAFSIIKQGNANGLDWKYFIMFTANGLLSFLAVFFIYAYEKIFGLVSDVTLLELSNTNSKLLRELNEKAPGTFQHSMQVANLAEAAANEIGANSMLARTGALYHDIGKMLNPQFFIENQSTGVNPHNDLSPKDSAQIIINHILKGIELAKKNNIPDRIIDFIRTHHGTSLVYYFYKQELERNPEVDIKKFKYQGPIPFSKETAILMMCDASEAASKSLKNPSALDIDKLINNIIEKQQSENQFINSNITFREIEKIKKVIKNKLMNIYHLRIEYPE